MAPPIAEDDDAHGDATVSQLEGGPRAGILSSPTKEFGVSVLRLPTGEILPEGEPVVVREYVTHASYDGSVYVPPLNTLSTMGSRTPTMHGSSMAVPHSTQGCPIPLSGHASPRAPPSTGMYPGTISYRSQASPQVPPSVAASSYRVTSPMAAAMATGMSAYQPGTYQPYQPTSPYVPPPYDKSSPYLSAYTVGGPTSAPPGTTPNPATSVVPPIKGTIGTSVYPGTVLTTPGRAPYLKTQNPPGATSAVPVPSGTPTGTVYRPSGATGTAGLTYTYPPATPTANGTYSAVPVSMPGSARGPPGMVSPIPEGGTLAPTASPGAGNDRTTSTADGLYAKNVQGSARPGGQVAYRPSGAASPTSAHTGGVVGAEGAAGYVTTFPTHEGSNARAGGSYGRPTTSQVPILPNMTNGTGSVTVQQSEAMLKRIAPPYNPSTLPTHIAPPRVRTLTHQRRGCCC